MPLQRRPGLVRDVPGVVGIHLHNLVRDVEIGSAASHHQNQGHPSFMPQIQRPFQERGNGLLVPGDYRLHQLVPHHEVGGGGVLVHEQHPAPCLQGLGDVGRLGSAAAGVQGGEFRGVPPAGQMVDKQGYVGVRHLTAVLCPDLHGGGVGDDVLPTVPGNVVVDAPLQGFQQGGFSVIAPSGDESDPPAHPHAPDRAPVGQLQGHRHGLRGLEGHGVFHGPIGHTALPGQDGPVRHESG